MIRLGRIAAILTLIVLGTSAVRADEPRVPGSPANPPARVGQGGAPMFQRLDANKDGQVSKPEFERAALKASQKKGQGKAGGMANGGRVFNRLDADKNGMLSPAEIEKLKQLRARQKGAR